MLLAMAMAPDNTASPIYPADIPCTHWNWLTYPAPQCTQRAPAMLVAMVMAPGMPACAMIWLSRCIWSGRAFSTR